jgi:hypothetical protein
MVIYVWLTDYISGCNIGKGELSKILAGIITAAREVQTAINAESSTAV